MKIAIAQNSTRPGHLKENYEKIVSYIEKAKSLGAELVVFPELALPGYAVMDLAYNPDFLKENKEYLNKIASQTTGIAAAIGFIDFEDGKFISGKRPLIYNSIAVIQDGKICGVQDKSLFPNYDIFFEGRYFSNARGINPIKLNGTSIGFQICEDLWDDDYPIKVSEQLVQKGAEILINVSASPYHIGKLSERFNTIGKNIKKLNKPFIYSNLIGVFDGYDGEVIFDGQSLAISKNGKVLAQGKPFVEEIILVDTNDSKEIELNKQERLQEVKDALVFGIKEFFRRSNATKTFLGLSGGIDSSLVAALCAEALGPENVMGILMPSHITSTESNTDAELLAKNLGIKYHTRPISPEFQAWKAEYTRVYSSEPNSLTKQNKQARIRGSILMEQTNQTPGSLVVNTGNKTEMAVGYCTLYGDMCGALSTIGDVSKTLVYELCNFINKSAAKEIIPTTVIDKIPTAELETGQTDRDNLPADYPILSPLVDAIVEEQLPYSELIKSYDKDVVTKTIKLINNNEFKRRQAAPALRITKHAFGNGRRIPSDSPA